MARVSNNNLYDDDNGAFVASISNASPDSVRLVLDASEDHDNGRSQWVWVRLANGDLCLALFPQGDTYFETEEDWGYRPSHPAGCQCGPDGYHCEFAQAAAEEASERWEMAGRPSVPHPAHTNPQRRQAWGYDAEAGW